MISENIMATVCIENHIYTNTMVNTPLQEEGVYWSKPPSKGFYYCLEGVYWSIPPLGRRGYIDQYPHCEKGGNLFFSNYNGNGIGIPPIYRKYLSNLRDSFVFNLLFG